MIKRFLTIAIGLTFSLPAIADKTIYIRPTHSLGFAAGGTYGVGLSYSYDTQDWGIQVTGLPIWDQSS